MPRSRLPEGLYDELVTTRTAAQIAEAVAGGLTAQREALEEDDTPEIVGHTLGAWLARVLAYVPEQHRPAEQVAIANRLVEATLAALRDVGAKVPEEATEAAILPERLLALFRPAALAANTTSAPARPHTPLRANALLTNAREERSLLTELSQEVASADRIDLLCAFLKFGGFVKMRPHLRAHRERGRPLRVLTTTYLGSTERRVLDELVAMGAEVRVSYDTRSTRLHAKAWLFHRHTEYSTAYVGSSNLSATALTEGLEWNVRLSEVESPSVLGKFQSTFETYWESPDFEPYEPAKDGARFEAAIQRARGEGASLPDDTPLLGLDVHPRAFQEAILERLLVERVVHGRTRNLVVAATGTGKTMIAAFDYRRLVEDLESPSLLFVAHRAEILRQSRRTFREVLRDGTFGELLVDGEKPTQGKHVFASVQSLARVDLAALAPEAFDVVIVDEFHHAAEDSKTYGKLLEHLRPKILLGLTATPERADGKSILGWFGDRIAAELRLWEAVERGFLCPFFYFGIGDEDVDLSKLTWKRGYDPTELENVLTADHARVKRFILPALEHHVASVRRMRAIGFCVSVKHARFMAEELTKLGVPATSVTGQESPAERAQAIQQLRRREVNVIFSVDVFNEGVDIPEVDTVLMLRPTESATVFLQQLGRGLRKADGKEGLTVLDFIGNPHERFRFDLRFRPLTPAGGTAAVRRQVEQGFPTLPSGCSIQLDAIAQARVLANVKAAVSAATARLVEDMRALGRDLTLRELLTESGIELAQVYKRSGKGGTSRLWRDLRAAAGLAVAEVRPGDEELLACVQDLVSFDDPVCLRLWLDALRRESPPARFDPDEPTRRRWQMLAVSFDERAPRDLDATLRRLWSPAVREELVALFEVLEDAIAVEPVPLRIARGGDVPLHVHCRYSLVQILAAFDEITANGNVARPQQGVYLAKKARADLLLVTLEKSEREYSASTMYKDYAISPTEFHWESQNDAVPTRGAGLRHVDPAGQDVTPLLFVRKRKKDDRGRTMTYELLGPVKPLSWKGELPIQIVWGLSVAMPAVTYSDARVVAA